MTANVATQSRELDATLRAEPVAFESAGHDTQHARQTWIEIGPRGPSRRPGVRLFLATHVVLWSLGPAADRIGPGARAAIADASELCSSVVSFAEIGVKASVGKLPVPDELHAHVLTAGLRILPLAPDHDWPSPHFRSSTAIRLTVSSPRRPTRSS